MQQIAVRAGGRRVGVKRSDDKKKKKQNEDDDTAKLKPIFRAIALGVAAFVVCGAIMVLCVIVTGRKLPDPKVLIQGIAAKTLQHFNIANVIISFEGAESEREAFQRETAAVSLSFGLVIWLLNMWRSFRERQSRIRVKEALANQKRLLQEQRRKERVEMCKKKAELEEKDMESKGVIVAQLEQREKERKQRYEQEKQALQEKYRKELALQQKLAEETRRHASMVAANQTIHMHGNDGCVSHEGKPQSSLPYYEDEISNSNANNEDDHGDDYDNDGCNDNKAMIDIELNPLKSGFEFNISTKIWWNIATLRVNEIHLRLLCNRCSLGFAVRLSGIYEADCQISRRCSNPDAKLFSEHIFVHKLSTKNGNQALATRIRGAAACFSASYSNSSCDYSFLDTSECQTQDVVSVLLDGVCMACSNSVSFKQAVVRSVRREAVCTRCHQKLAIEIDNITFSYYSSSGTLTKYPPPGTGPSSSGANRTSVPSKNQQAHIVRPGQPLPNHGACKHFRKSLRFYRHLIFFVVFYKMLFLNVYAVLITANTDPNSGCDGGIDGRVASHVICGNCSHEQAVNSTYCVICAMPFVAKKLTGHWAGGGGTRNTTMLTSKERKKNQGESRRGVKKTQSKKSQRVGKAGKAARQVAAASTKR
eukprot:gene4805-102_t